MSKPLSDRAIFDPAVAITLTQEQAINYVQERIDNARLAIKNYPSPDSVIINSKAQESWRMRTSALYGQAVGALCALQAFGLIPIAQFKQLKKELMSAWNLRLVNEVAGNQIK